MRLIARYSVIWIFLSLCLNLPQLNADESIFEENWLGIYSGDQRIGYSHSSIRKNINGFTKATEITKLKVKLLGKNQEVETEGRYNLDNYEIKSFSFFMSAESLNIRAEGRREGQSLLITMETISGKTDIKVPIDRVLILPSLFPKWLIDNNSPLNMKRAYEVSLFDPVAILMGVKIEDLVSNHRIEGKETLRTPHLAGGAYAYRVSSSFQGAKYTTWITPNGQIVKQIIPPGLVAVRESKDDILRGNYYSYDITGDTSIKPTKAKLAKARALKHLRVRINGIELSEKLNIRDGYRQFLQGRIVNIKSTDLKEITNYQLPYKGEKFSKYLKPAHLIQSNDDKIVSKTKNVLNGETDSLKAASKINKWIYENLKKEGAASIPSAKDTLHTKAGDCNEHAALFAAMARAAGIPTKIILGTVYVDGSFRYHAWNEVFIGKWVAVDSMFGQIPADATHIKLIEGDLIKGSQQIMGIVGKINFEIL